MKINVTQPLNTQEVEKKLPGAWAIPIYEGKALTLKRVDGMWDFPGGTIDPGETSLQGAVRELEEEAGIKVKMTDLRPIGVHIIDGRYLNVFVVPVTKAQVDGIKLQLEEHTEYTWVSKYQDIPGDINPPTKEFRRQGWLDTLNTILSGLQI
jgi:8-oxo-dGTP pyrophosphatase MutT (NUDIX family)